MKPAAIEMLSTKRAQFSRSSRRDAAAGWREALQDKRLHGVLANPLKLGLQVKLMTSFGL